MSDHSTTQELIENIEKKDRRFRTAQAIFMTILFSVLVGIIFFQYRTLQSVQNNLTQQKTIVDTIKKSNQSSLDTINRHLDCIVVYFGQQNRQNLTIQDINKCTLQSSNGAQTFFSQPQSSQGLTPSNTATPTTPSTPSSTQSVTPAPTTSPTGTPQPTPTPTPQPPITVLGIPICVPFTGVCVR